MREMETMLEVVRGHGKVEVGQDKALENLGSWAQEGNTAVTATKVSRFNGLRDGEDNGLFYISGICAPATERLNILVRYSRPAGPKCFRCIIVSPSGPVAVEFLHCLMMVAVLLAVKGVKS